MSGANSGMSAKAAGRILAGVFLVGLVLSLFVGELAITLTAFPIAALLFVWLVVGCKREIGPAIRRGAWTTVLVIAIEYGVFFFILALSVWGVVKFLGFNG